MALKATVITKLTITARTGLVMAIAATVAGAYTLGVYKPTQAAPGSTYTSISTADPWDQGTSLSRGDPSGGYTATNSSVSLAVDSTNSAGSGDSPLQTEALSKTIPDANSVKGTLFVDPAWQGLQTRAGLWGQVYSSQDSSVLPGYPLIEFTTVGEDGFAGFRVWDTRGGVSPKWYNLTDVNFNWGESYALEIAYNSSSDSYDFYVNDTKALSLGASHSDNDGSSRDTFRTLLLATYNFDTGSNDDDYSALWTGLQAGTAGQENSGPNNGDANNDGIPDSQQANVTSFVNQATNQYAAVAVSDGCSLTDANGVNAASLAGDDGYSYPVGLLDFTANCGTPGFTTTVTQYFYSPPEADFVLRKLAHNSYQTVSDATISRQTIGGQAVLTVSYSVTDGGELDVDGQANGIIVDPAGPAVSALGTPNSGLLRQNIWPVTLAAVAGAGLLASLAVSPIRQRIYGSIFSKK